MQMLNIMSKNSSMQHRDVSMVWNKSPSCMKLLHIGLRILSLHPPRPGFYELNMELLKELYLEMQHLDDQNIVDNIETLIAEVRDLSKDTYICTNMNNLLASRCIQ